MKESIDRVEVLKEIRAHGANAIGGTIHIFIEKGKSGFRQNTTFQLDQMIQIIFIIQ